MRYSIFLIFTLAVSWHIALAADSTFTIRTLIGADTIPPTTPTNLVALPISTTQIDLTWDASTDNYLFGGYQVWRDAVQLATTTLTNYSDTGLTASTTYSYYIVAFDEALNYSTSSSIVSTSTLQVVATSTPTTASSSNTGQSSKPQMSLTNLEIDTTETTANISFDTSVYTKVTWRWGRTINYESGYVASDIYRQQHQTVLTDLEPGTVYELEIILTRRFSGENYIERVQFKTDSPIDNQPPPNVGNFSAKLQPDGEVSLTWNNPNVEDFAYVRVLSNDYFYPLDTADGWFVYEGDREEILDDRLLQVNRFYTIFVYDTAGNRSSGAVTYITKDTRVDSDFPSVSPEVDKEPILDPYANFDFSKLEVYQNGQILPQFEGTITLDSKSDTTFKIPYEQLPENLKTIILTLTDPNDKTKTFSFLLAINAQRSAYEASIGELAALGYYETTINIYDYSAAVVSQKSGGVIVSDGFFSDRSAKVVEEIRLLINWPLVSVAIAILASLLGIIFWRRWHSEDKPKHQQ